MTCTRYSYPYEETDERSFHIIYFCYSIGGSSRRPITSSLFGVSHKRKEIDCVT
jgi:hypothetical protein